ncbi:MAG TPA: hypothetical protein VFX92_00925 [Candidatus Krumholzibacteria bacterium]|nr:hypothetical protein [Candidatus Krumholzibacteria bacterium]
MRSLLCALLLAGLAVPLLTRPAAAIDDAAGRERLGVRASYITSNDGLRDSYGDGWDLTLYFTETVLSKLVLDIRLGAIYLGEALKPDLDDQITNSYGVVSQMRVLYFSVGPMVGFRLGGANTGYASAGVGIYSVSIQLDSAISAYDLSDQEVGFNGGIGIARRLSTNWSLEGNATVHYFGIASNNLYGLFTENADSPLLLGIGLGVTVDLR